MSDRRSFIKSAVFSTIALPLISPSGSEARTLPKANSFVPEFPAQNDPKFWKNVRKMFPMREGETYLNNGSLGPMPTPVLDRMIEEMRSSMENAARFDWSREGWPQLVGGIGGDPENRVREKLAKLIHAETTEVSLTQNSTMGHNFIANGFDLDPGDEIIMTDQEHTGGRCGWQMMEMRKKAVVKMIKIPDPPNDPEVIFKRFAEAVTPKTRVIAFAHITSSLGIILPAKKICDMARERGIFTVVDGAHAIGQIPLDMKDIGCDAYFSSAHKWLLAPAGSGCLYIRNDVAPTVWTTIASGGWEKENCKDHGNRFTARSCANQYLAAGFEAAIDFHNQLGPRKVTDRIKYLGDYFRAGLKKIDKVEIKSSVHPEMCAGMTSYTITGVDSAKLREELWNRKKLRQRGIRFCTHIYNSVEEIDASLEVIRDLAKNA